MWAAALWLLKACRVCTWACESQLRWERLCAFLLSATRACVFTETEWQTDWKELSDQRYRETERIVCMWLRDSEFRAQRGRARCSHWQMKVKRRETSADGHSASACLHSSRSHPLLSCQYLPVLFSAPFWCHSLPWHNPLFVSYHTVWSLASSSSVQLYLIILSPAVHVFWFSFSFSWTIQAFTLLIHIKYSTITELILPNQYFEPLIYLQLVYSLLSYLICSLQLVVCLILCTHSAFTVPIMIVPCQHTLEVKLRNFLKKHLSKTHYIYKTLHNPSAVLKFLSQLCFFFFLQFWPWSETTSFPWVFVCVLSASIIVDFSLDLVEICPTDDMQHVLV